MNYKHVNQPVMMNAPGKIKLEKNCCLEQRLNYEKGYEKIGNIQRKILKFNKMYSTV